MIAQNIDDMPKTCEGCTHREDKKYDVSPCDKYSLGTHIECYDKMNEDISAERKAYFKSIRNRVK